ncbi:MAG: carboxypeptidase-like regulatory domain-containing protein, partial [Marinilabilia sp.]
MKKGVNDLYQAIPFKENRRMFNLKGIFLLIMFCCSLSVFSQDTKTVEGNVLDDNRDPVPGATVVVKGNTSYGTVTSSQGEFSLDIPSEENVLVVSFVGMETQEVNVSDQTDVTVVLQIASIQLEETVVVGYGQQKKKSIIGS